MSKSTLDQGETNGLLAVFKGESGVGKTTAALSFPNVYVFDFDCKMPSIAAKHYPGKDISYDTFETTLLVDEKIRELKSNCPYETLVLDSFTFMGDLVFNTGAWLKSKKEDKGFMDAYQEEVRFSSRIMGDLKTLHVRKGNPKHILVMAHLEQYEGAPNFNGGSTKFRNIVAQGRKAGVFLHAAFDNVFLFGYGQRQFINQPQVRTCYTQGVVGEDIAKCSFLGFPDTIDIGRYSLYDQLFPQKVL